MSNTETRALLHVNGESFDPDDLTFGEMREVRRLVRTELWDTDLLGEFDWDLVQPDDVIAATVVVWKRRENPDYKIDDALELKPTEVYGDGDAVPPTKAKSSPQRAPAQKKASGTSGSRT